MHPLVLLVQIAKAYEAGGAACLSVLTDKKFFQGSFENLRLIRQAGVTCPLLCKEFIVEVSLQAWVGVLLAVRSCASHTSR